MQELEVVREKIQNKYRVVKTDEDLEWNRAIDLCTNIINVHLSCENDPEIERSSRDNDGWIPVEQRLPEKDGFYIATIDGEIIGEDDPFVGLAEFDRGDWYDNEDYTRVIAWRPLPDPYRPESKTEKPDWRQGMLRKFDRRE